METKGHMGSITFDGHMIMVTKKLRAQVRFPVEAVTSIEVVPAGLGMKGVKFTVAGGVATQPIAAVGGNRHARLMEDPYALTFKSKRMGDFQELISQIEEAQRNASQRR